MIAYLIGVIYLVVQLRKVFEAISMQSILHKSLIFPVVTSTFIFFTTKVLTGHWFANKYTEFMFACLSLLVAYSLIFFKDRRYRALWEAISTVRL